MSKALFFVILGIAVIEGVYIYLTHDQTATYGLPPYLFYDSRDNGDDSLVSANGSWITSQTNLAFPLSTLNIECWKDFGYCWIAQ